MVVEEKIREGLRHPGQADGQGLEWPALSWGPGCGCEGHRCQGPLHTAPSPGEGEVWGTRTDQRFQIEKMAGDGEL